MIASVRKLTTQVILSTAQVQIEDANQNMQRCRVLLDPGSQSNLITEELVRKLKLKCKDKYESSLAALIITDECHTKCKGKDQINAR